MKSFLLLIIASSVSLCAAAQSTISFRSKVTTGVGVQQGKFKNAYGIGGAFETPFKKINALKFNAGIDFGINGIRNLPYEFRFNGSVTNTKVHYTSYVIQVSSGAKYMFRDNKGWSPYIGLSAGILNYYTDMSIEDPNDPDGCSPMETKPVSYSMVITGAAEAGLRIRPKQRGSGSISYFELGTQYIAGTRGKYLRLGDDHDHHTEAEDNYMIKFRQNSTGLEHDHKLGTLYRTPTSQLAYHFAVIFQL